MKKILVSSLIALTFSAAAAAAAVAAPAGSLDRSFSGDGLAMLKAGYGPGTGIAGTPDGKVVQVTSRSRVARFTSRGRLDRSFGHGGTIKSRIGGTLIHPVDVLVDRKNRIIVGGGCRHCGPREAKGVAIGRFLPNGQPDRSFANRGVAVRNIGGDRSSQELAFRPGGKIAAVGQNGSRGYLIGLRASGGPDRSFSRNGVIWLNGAFKAVQSVAVDKAGRIVVGGRYAQRGLGKVMGVARFLPNGNLDRSFSGDGVAAFRTYNATGGTVSDLTVDRRGRVVGVGNDGSVHAIVFRLNTKGALDKSFSDDGNAAIGNMEANSVSVDPKGRILMLGNSRSEGSESATAVIVRLGGKGTFRFKSPMVTINDHFVDAKGRIVATGYTRHFTAAVRVLNP